MAENDIDAEEHVLAPAIARLFEGYSQAYGTYSGTSENAAKGGKLEIKATARTVRGIVDRRLWSRHLFGEASLGVIPIREDNTCVWGVIDVDSYDVSLAQLYDQVEKEGLPLVVCRSKSGGAHLFLFAADPVPAQQMRDRLREMAALLSVGSAEVFPKQVSVNLGRGDLGNWLNMPYFDEKRTDRYAVKKGGLEMTLAEFVDYASRRQVDRETLSRERRKKPQQSSDFGDGPPCMQHLAAVGFPEGTRNKGLFALATFAKRKYGTRWQEMVEQWNREFFNPPLGAVEVLEIIKQQDKKDYNYTCRDAPLSAHCNSHLCRARKYGVGGEDDVPVISGLAYLDTDPPLWFLDVDDTRLELTTEELQNFRLFHKVCMERLLKCFRMVKQDVWLSIVGTAMRDATKIEASAEVGLSGQFEELLEEFLNDRHKADDREEILLGRPWFDDKTEAHYFRLKDLERFLNNAGFKVYSRNMMVSRIKALGGGDHFFNFKGKGVNTWWVPNMNRPIPRPRLPRAEADPI